MWRLILPDCQTCDVRKASWGDKLCVMCRAEVELLEEMLTQDSASKD